MAVELLTFLHVATMFLAVALSLGPAILLRAVARGRDARSIQAFAEPIAGLGRYIGPLFILGGALGLSVAIVGGFNLLAPWLIIAYVLYVIGTGVGALGEGKWTQDVAKAAAANPERAAGPELVAVLTSTRGVTVFVTFSGIIALLVFDMVVKPFS
jgi:uncharacterized membrane protein